MLIKNLICPVIKLHSSDLIYERLNNNTNSNHLWSDPNRARRMASLTRYKELETASPALNPFVSPSITFEYFQRLNVPLIHLNQWPIILAINWGWTKMSSFSICSFDPRRGGGKLIWYPDICCIYQIISCYRVIMQYFYILLFYNYLLPCYPVFQPVFVGRPRRSADLGR